MRLKNTGADIWVPDGASLEEAVTRTTHMGISAHADDLEILAYPAILECFGRKEKRFMGVVVTDGAGSERSGPYAQYTDAQMRAVRRLEQKKAAFVGEYSAMVLLDYSSKKVKEAPAAAVVADLKELLLNVRPQVVFTHNLADKHDTHVATALRVIDACRELRESQRPRRLMGGEVWRDLDWMTDTDKVPLDVASRESLAMALLGVFDSQITGGKRYDLATQGRRRAHATYHESHGLDATTALTFAMDMSPLLTDTALDPAAFVKGFIGRFEDEVKARLERLSAELAGAGRVKTESTTSNHRT
jgi:LmbE family N-acetylglucosaminyl deacetylase